MDGRSQICHPWPELSDNWKQWTTTTCFSWTSNAKFGGQVDLVAHPKSHKELLKKYRNFQFWTFYFWWIYLTIYHQKALKLSFFWSIKKPAKWASNPWLFLWFKLPKKHLGEVSIFTNLRLGPLQFFWSFFWEKSQQKCDGFFAKVFLYQHNIIVRLIPTKKWEPSEQAIH